MTNRKYRGWNIETLGGFITCKRFHAKKADQWFWRFKLRDVKTSIDQLENGMLVFDQLDSLYKEALF